MLNGKCTVINMCAGVFGCRFWGKGELKQSVFDAPLWPTAITIVSLFSVVLCVGPSALAHPDAHEALHLTSEKLKEEPHNKELMLKRAYLLRLAGHHQEALDKLNSLIKKYPNYMALYFQRALTYRELKDYRQAELDLTRIIKCGRKSPEIFAERAAIREKTQQYRAAIADYQSGSEYLQDEDFHLRFGRLYQKLGLYENASKVFSKALKRWPSSVVLTRALVELEICQTNYQQAHRTIDVMLAKRRFKTPWLLLRAKVYEAAGEKAKARKTWAKALKECESKIKAGKRNGIHRTYRVEVLLATGELDKADKEIGTILEEFPDYFRAVELKRRIEWKKSKVKGQSEISGHDEAEPIEGQK